jgi:hypothetical protein
MSDPQMRKMLDDESTEFDVGLATIIPSSEIAYFLAHKFKAQIFIYCTAQGHNLENSMLKVSTDEGLG